MCNKNGELHHSSTSEDRESRVSAKVKQRRAPCAVECTSIELADLRDDELIGRATFHVEVTEVLSRVESRKK